MYHIFSESFWHPLSTDLSNDTKIEILIYKLESCKLKNIAHAAWVFQSLCVFRNLSICVFAYIIFSEKIYQSKSYAQLFERASRRNI